MSYEFVITEIGKNLLAKLIAGEQLEITRIMVGKGGNSSRTRPFSFYRLSAAYCAGNFNQAYHKK